MIIENRNKLTDHLGNVMAVVTDVKKPNLSGFTPDVVAYSDYYPFGMLVPGRHCSVDGYRYAYQGQEKDPETGKEAFQLRLYDSRINRWLTTDPAGQYASPYLAMGNNWVSRIDPDGGRDTDPSDGAVVYGEDVPGLELITLRDIGGHVNYLDEVVIPASSFAFIKIPNLSTYEGLSITMQVAIPWKRENQQFSGYGLSFGVLESEEGLNFFRTRKRATDKGNISMGISIDYLRAENISQTNKSTKVTSDMIYGYGTEVGFDFFGGYSLSTDLVDGVNENAHIQIHAISVGYGIDIGAARWHTITD